MSDGNGWTDPDTTATGAAQTGDADQGLPEPGWYPDPEIQGGLRYWDGSAWTEHRHQPEPEPTAGWGAPTSASEATAGQGSAPPGSTVPEAGQPAGTTEQTAAPSAPGGATGWGAGGGTTAAAGTPDWASPQVVKRGVGAGAVIAIAAVALLFGFAGGFGVRMLTESDGTAIVTDGGGGDQIDGALSPGDRADVELTGRVLRVPVSIPSDGDYTIDASSNDFDTVLTLYRGGTEVAYNDDGPFGLDSQIDTFLEAGNYTLELTAWDDRSTGRATLSIG